MTGIAAMGRASSPFGESCIDASVIDSGGTPLRGTPASAGGLGGEAAEGSAGGGLGARFAQDSPSGWPQLRQKR
jgi:hypothetical protein